MSEKRGGNEEMEKRGWKEGGKFRKNKRVTLYIPAVVYSPFHPSTGLTCSSSVDFL